MNERITYIEKEKLCMEIRTKSEREFLEGIYGYFPGHAWLTFPECRERSLTRAAKKT